MTASDSRAVDAARSEARKVSGWSSSIQHPYRPLGVIAPVILPQSYKKKGSNVRNGHVLHTFTTPRPPTPLSSSIDTAAVAAPAHLIPRPPPRNDISASSRGEHEGGAGSGSVSSRRRLVASDSFQYDAAAPIMPHRGNLQRQNSKVSLQPAVIDAIEPAPSHRPLFLINTSD